MTGRQTGVIIVPSPCLRVLQSPRRRGIVFAYNAVLTTMAVLVAGWPGGGGCAARNTQCTYRAALYDACGGGSGSGSSGGGGSKNDDEYNDRRLNRRRRCRSRRPSIARGFFARAHHAADSVVRRSQHRIV